MRYACQLLVILLASASIGCAMCQNTFDDDYAAYGGVRDRLDRVHGRVGSLFDPAASLATVPVADAPTAEDRILDAPLGDAGDELDDPADERADEEGLSDDLRSALERAQDSLPPAMDDET